MRATDTPYDRPLRPSEFVMSFSSTRHGARLARLLVAERMNAWGVSYDSEDSSAVALLVAELAANAVVHGHHRGWDFRLRVTRRQHVVRVEVTDTRADRRPAPASPRPSDTSGRGLLIVSAIASRWGVAECARGKTVWCEYVLSH
ncbi:ATP-binding protein [Streptomyces sp. ACA25]|uniref:ATP-binding protein n=1 Tax=Streptomyces sp. ACA25 TaxID=3022596 RepID=UPI00230770AA|nr:ATP-binding protein [Streptomyces sp. ACA25]MDB1088419.1 ATP-binding protein [Streptomyces sp. ACA25]